MSDTKDVVEQSLIAQISALVFQRVPAHKIAEQLGITRYRAEKIIKSAEFKAHLKDLGDRAAETALAHFKQNLDELAPLAYEALKHNLKEKKLDAVRIFGEFVGANRKEDGEQKDTSLTIIMPGAPAPEKSVESEVIEIEGSKSDET